MAERKERIKKRPELKGSSSSEGCLRNLQTGIPGDAASAPDEESAARARGEEEEERRKTTRVRGLDFADGPVSRFQWRAEEKNSMYEERLGEKRERKRKVDKA